MTKKRVGINAFSKELRNALQAQPDKYLKLKELSEDDLIQLMDVIFYTIATIIRSGRSVIFERFFSLTRKPIKRSGFNKDKSGYELNYAKRLRFTPTQYFRKITEETLSKEEYEALTKPPKQK